MPRPTIGVEGSWHVGDYLVAGGTCLPAGRE
jgi:hypothetical protein